MPHAAPPCLVRPFASALLLALVLASSAFAAPAPPSAPLSAPVVVAPIAATDSARAAAPVDYVALVRKNFTPENRAYSSLRAWLSLVAPFYSIAIALLVLFTGLSARLRDLAYRASRRRYVRVLIYLALYSLVASLIGLPFDWFSDFHVEHHYGLSSQPFLGWLGEQGIGLAVSIALFGVVPVLALAYRALERRPRGWWVWLACGSLPVILAIYLVSPYVDMLTNKFRPLRDPVLQHEIVALAQRAGIPGRQVFEVDKSKQTHKYNAYVTGFGVSQRIVLWDTTLKGMRHDEILFVMGHEMGHYVLRHIWIDIVAFTLLAFVLFWFAERLLDPVVARFGPRWGFTTLHDVASLPLILAMLGLLSFIAQPVTNGMTRITEHQADVFGLELTRDNDAAARAFIQLGSQNRADPEPPAWRVWLQYSHPPLGERVRFAMTYRPWEHGAPNRLFHGAPAGEKL